MQEQSTDYNVTPISMGKSNAYLVSGTNSAFLVDTGYAKNINNLEQALERNELEITDIDFIIVTHAHNDHVGHLAEIMEKSGAKVLAHTDEAECLKKGHTPIPAGTILFSKMISKLGNRFFPDSGKYTPVEPDLILQGECGLLTEGLPVHIMHTPGHTSGSLCVVINNECAIVGDTLSNMLPGSVLPIFANDEATLINSWEKLLSTGCNTFYPGHGKPFSREKFMKCFEKYKK